MSTHTPPPGPTQPTHFMARHNGVIVQAEERPGETAHQAASRVADSVLHCSVLIRDMMKNGRAS